MAALVVLIIVSISGCTDKSEEVQDEVNIYVYEQTGEEGDPQEQIREFYDMVDEQSCPPILVPLRKQAAEYELDPETGQVIPDTNGDFGIKAGGVRPIGIDKEDCIDLGGGLYAYVYNLSETPRNGATVRSTYPFTSELSIADKKNKGKYAQFQFIKESI